MTTMPTSKGELVRNVKKRVSFVTGPRAKRHEEMARHEYMPNVPQA